MPTDKRKSSGAEMKQIKKKRLLAQDAANYVNITTCFTRLPSTSTAAPPNASSIPTQLTSSSTAALISTASSSAVLPTASSIPTLLTSSSTAALISTASSAASLPTASSTTTLLISSSTARLDSTAAQPTVSAAPTKNQPLQFIFPKSRFGKRERSCCALWFNQFKWLHYDEVIDSVFCFDCMTSPSVERLSAKSEDAFITRGFSNWKKAVDRFREHQSSHCHRAAVEFALLPRACGDIGGRLSLAYKKETAQNREMFLHILRSIRYLGRQGIALRGHNDTESNFVQLLKLYGQTDCRFENWLNRNDCKYTSPDCQNECLQIMAFQILRKISSHIQSHRFYALMADEVTDSSNKEQLVICLRWIDDQFNAHEDFIGIYSVDNITADTIVASLKDVLLRLNLNISRCRGQCYDGASNMTGAKKGVSTQFQVEEPRALLTHCYGHSLQLAACDTIKQIKILQDALDTTNEISKLIKYSPKRDRMLEKLKDELSPGTPGFRILCPTRWTVRSGSLQSIIDNWIPLKQLWEDCLGTKLDSEIKARINGVSSQMCHFDYLYGVHLALLLLRHCDNLSKTLQSTSMSATHGQAVATMTVKTLKSLRSTEKFDLLWLKIGQDASRLEVAEAKLPRFIQRPRRYNEGSDPQPIHQSPETYYRQLYFNSIDTVVNCIEDRFNQRDYKIYAHLEDLLIKAGNGKDYDEELDTVLAFYGNDFDAHMLRAQLQSLHTLMTERGSAQEAVNFTSILEMIKSMPQPMRSLMSEVSTVITLLLTAPATNAVSERSCSALRRIKTYLRTTMTQARLNNCLIMHCHKEHTDALDLVKIATEFTSTNDSRFRVFGSFDIVD
jgi:Domain of unknown function (DUF4371)/hAT family C-terminal dimerisation region